MGCPEGWLDWDTHAELGFESRLSGAITGGVFLFRSLSAEAQLPQKPHYVELPHNKDKVLSDTRKFFKRRGGLEDAAAGSWTMFRNLFPVACDLSLTLLCPEGIADTLKMHKGV